MHVTFLWGSHVVLEKQPEGFSGAVVVLVSFIFWIGQFLRGFAGYEDWAAVFEVFFNLAEIHVFSLLNVNVVVVVVVKQ